MVTERMAQAREAAHLSRQDVIAQHGVAFLDQQTARARELLDLYGLTLEDDSARAMLVAFCDICAEAATDGGAQGVVDVMNAFFIAAMEAQERAR